MADVVLLTEDRYERPAEVDWYIGNILIEDGLIERGLRRHGLTAERVSWSRPDFDWSKPRAVLIRTPWDYFFRFAEFSPWLDRVSRQTRLINDAPLLRWNIDKHYLRDLESAGVAIPSTRYIEPRTDTTLRDVFLECGWSEAILKPAISGVARHTYRITAEAIAEREAIFRELLANEAWILQPFLPSVLADGELSLIVIGGRYCHAVRKRSKPGDFRVQDDFGGTVAEHSASAEEIAFAERAVTACPHRPAYARVDLVRDESCRLVVMELEAIEPELFLRFNAAAAEALADEVARLLA